MIQHLPIEVWANITTNLSNGDILNLALCCKRFNEFFNESIITRQLVENEYKYTEEYQELQRNHDYEQARERLRDRVLAQRAIREAKPFLETTIHGANSFICTNGVLGYIWDDKFSLLYLWRITRNKHPRSRILLTNLIWESGTNTPWSNMCEVRPIHFNCDILSFLCVFPEPKQYWLVVMDIGRRKGPYSQPLSEDSGLFVRNDHSYLWYGTHEDNEERCWVLRSLNLEAGEWANDVIRLPHSVGIMVGATVSFEIISNYLYAISIPDGYNDHTGHLDDEYRAFQIPV
ncbi:hypothetical protein B0I35DRAFT_365698, partial [Stachybotrys elegans]